MVDTHKPDVPSRWAEDVETKKVTSLPFRRWKVHVARGKKSKIPTNGQINTPTIDIVGL